MLAANCLFGCCGLVFVLYENARENGGNKTKMRAEIFLDRRIVAVRLGVLVGAQFAVLEILGKLRLRRRRDYASVDGRVRFCQRAVGGCGVARRHGRSHVPRRVAFGYAVLENLGSGARLRRVVLVIPPKPRANAVSVLLRRGVRLGGDSIGEYFADGTVPFLEQRRHFNSDQVRSGELSNARLYRGERTLRHLLDRRSRVPDFDGETGGDS